MDLIAKLFDVHKVPFKIVLVVFLASLLPFVAGDALNARMHLDGLMTKYGWAAGITCVFSGLLVAVNVVIGIYGGIRGRWTRRAQKARLPQAIAKLDHAQIAVLREFRIQAKTVIDLPAHEATVVGLVNRGILHMESNQGPVMPIGLVLPYSLTEEASKLLTPDILGVPNGDVTPEMRATILSTRPQFVREIEDYKYRGMF